MINGRVRSIEKGKYISFDLHYRVEGEPILENIGSSDPISVFISVQNFGEPAYATMVYIEVPAAFEFADVKSIDEVGQAYNMYCKVLYFCGVKFSRILNLDLFAGS